MSFDISRDSFNAWNDYFGVVMQQGRVQLDSDWNELLAEISRRIQAGTMDTMGRAVYPATTPFAFFINPGATSIGIGAGRMYVDGLLVENHGPTSSARWDVSLAELSNTPPGAKEVDMDFTQQPYFPGAKLPTAAGLYIAYVDVWQREIIYLQDPGMVEIAVGVDSTGRWQTAWQINLLNVSSVVGGVTCTTPDDSIPPWQTLIQPSAGRLTTGVVQSTPDGPCCLTPNTGYTGKENQLYRVEIHQVSPKLTFKWSRDNASIVTAVTDINSATTQQGKPCQLLTVQSTGRDDVLSFNPGGWIEITDDFLELNRSSGELHQIDVSGVDKTVRTIRLADTLLTSDIKSRLDAFNNKTSNFNPHTRIVRWDQAGKVYQQDQQTVWTDLDAVVSTGDIPVPPAGTTLVLEDGITVSFNLDPAGGAFNVQDYWIFKARSADGSVELLTSAPPKGIHHHYARLAVVTVAGSTITSQDCRIEWPPAAAPNDGCCCTVTLKPSDVTSDNSMQAIFDKYAKVTQPVVICLLPGTYSLSPPLRLTKVHSNFTLKACQAGSAILMAASGSEEKFSDGLIGCSEVSNFTLDGVVLRLPTTSDLKTSIGLSVQNCQDLAVKNCQFEFGKQQVENFVAAAGILATGDCVGLVIEHNRFIGPNPFQSSARSVSFGFITIGSFADSSLPSLDAALFSDNTFKSLTLGILTAGTLGVVKAEGNQINDCFGGIWLNSYEATPSSTLGQWLAQAATDDPTFANMAIALRILGILGQPFQATKATPLCPRFHLANNQIAVGSTKLDSGFALLLTATPAPGAAKEQSSSVIVSSSVILSANELRAFWIGEAVLITGFAFVSITGNLILNLKPSPDATTKIPLGLRVFPPNVGMAVAGNVLNGSSNLGPGYPPRTDVQPIPFDRKVTPFWEQLNTWKFSNFEPLPPP